MEKLVEKANLFVLNQNNLKSVLDGKGIILDTTNKNKVIDYLRSFKPSWVTSAKIIDIFTNEKIPICNNSFTDGVYEWTESDLYHIENYDASLNKDFINSIIGINTKEV